MKVTYEKKEIDAVWNITKANDGHAECVETMSCEPVEALWWEKSISNCHAELVEALKHKNLYIAKQSFIDNMKRFSIYYKENPEAEHMNYVFGNLNKEMWELMHRKHFTHHFEQFNLI